MKLKNIIKRILRLFFPTLEDRFHKWLLEKDRKSYSQDKQDLFVQFFYKDEKGPLFFVDIGANDGISFSNTYLLENDPSHKWGGGVLIEADSNVYTELLKNRSNPKIKKHNVALCNTDGEVSFMQITGYAQMLSGIVSEYDKRHLEWIEREVNRHGSDCQIVKMQGARFDTIMKGEQKKIDYLSIDVEGGEMKILESINFDNYDIRLIGIENNYGCDDIYNFLKPRGYKKILRLGCDDFYIKEH
ncbi:FkbM family methyltransferase [Helicobacter suis]|uniref:FkbM family methyltransferase n=1 Tax=Helicobacter suis TaxID=104628 RepID=UPI0013D77947|nr:FkbM family methyltransferase [Helicobacter suis]